MSDGLVVGADGLARCWWPGADPLYLAYHDADWGVPERDGRKLYEKLVLDGFQAGLAWITILRKRENFRRAFAGFDPYRVAAFGEAEVAALLADAGIIRHRGKIEGAIKSARAWIAIEERDGFSPWLWAFVGGEPLQPCRQSRGEIPAADELSRRVSGALKEAGFAFCGPTVVYAFMQACGLINDHLVGCHRHAPCRTLARA